MKDYLFILGREPELSVAEIESRAGTWNLELLETTSEVAHVRVPVALEPAALAQLGGSIKLAEVLESLPHSSSVLEMIGHIVTPEWITSKFSTGRVEFGFSFYGCSKQERARLQASLLKLKRQIKSDGRPVRLVTSREPQLSAVTVTRQGLLKHGREFILVRGRDQDIIAQTLAVQDYQAYGLRDFGRPAANPKSGMLPPKLAQIMLNLAAVSPADIVLDPFCGSGTVLQEAVLLGAREVHGSDTEPRAVTDSQTNIRWLFKEYPNLQSSVEILKRDAADRPTRATVVVTEPALGKPLRGHEPAAWLNDQLRHLEKLYVTAFRRWAEVLPPGGRVVMVWPEFTVSEQARSPQIAAAITELGFTGQPLLSEAAARQLGHRDRFILRYGRPNARVQRLIRKWVKT